jgi:hypothetical protein
MAVSGTVQFTEVWRVIIEPRLYTYSDAKREYDVCAHSFGAAIAQALAFFNRDKQDSFRASPESITACIRSVLDVPLLVGSTVSAISYDETVADAVITPPIPDWDLCGTMPTVSVVSDAPAPLRAFYAKPEALPPVMKMQTKRGGKENREPNYGAEG